MSDSGKVPNTGKAAGTFLWERIINGPVRSRRLGLSLGINIIPPRSKICSFDCPYCECGFNTPKAPGERWPSPDIVADAVRKSIGFLPQTPDWLTFAGNGEPTLHPRFPSIVDRVLEARDAVGPTIRVGVLSNGLLAGRPAVRDALNRLDARMMKLDPGPPASVNGASYDRAAVVDAYRGLRDVIIQAMVVEGPGYSGADEAAIGAWLDALAPLQPSAVHLYSLDRAPADGRVRPVPRERLMQIAGRVRAVIAGDVLVF